MWCKVGLTELRLSVFHPYIVCIVAVVSAMVVMLHGIVPASFAGLALAYSSQLTGILQYTVRLAVETESRFTSVQRMDTYIKVAYSKVYN